MNNYANAIMATRGFAGLKVDATTMSVTEVQAWNKAMDALHSVAYSVAATRYNQVGSDAGTIVSQFYGALRDVYALIGELDNGAKLRADANCINTIVSMATCQKTRKSPDMEYACTQKRNAQAYLRKLEATNGANPTAIAKAKSDIEEAEARIEELKGESMQNYKQMGKSSASAFRKAISDFIGDQIESRAMLTEEEVQAEKRAKNAKVAEKRKAAKKGNK